MDPSPGAAIFLVISSKLPGFGIAGLLRLILIQPKRMLWPIKIPIVSLLETLHRDERETGFRLKVFWIVFTLLLVGEIVPEWIFSLLQDVVAAVHFDEQYDRISPVHCLIRGSLLRQPPGVSELPIHVPDTFSEYNLSALLTPEHEKNRAGLGANGILYLTETYIGYLITTNMGLTATVLHMFLWSFDDIKAGLAFHSLGNLKKLLDSSFYIFWKGGKTAEEHKREVLENLDMDTHYKLMVQEGYSEVPNWWYVMVLITSFVVGLGSLHGIQSTLPWWGYIISDSIAALFILFFGAQMGITGFQFNQQPISQIVAGYMHPGKPLANIYFTVFGFNGVQEVQWLCHNYTAAWLQVNGD